MDTKSSEKIVVEPYLGDSKEVVDEPPSKEREDSSVSRAVLSICSESEFIHGISKGFASSMKDSGRINFRRQLSFLGPSSDSNPDTESLSSCNVSISELLKLPGQNTLEREREAGEKDLEYLRQKKIREEREIIERIEEVNKEEKKKKKKEREMAEEERCNMVRLKIQEISLRSLEIMITDNIEHVENIDKGSLSSWRKQLFGKAGKDLELRYGWVGEPFTDEQFNLAHDMVEAHFNKKEQEYVRDVLAPELMLKLYQNVANVKSKEAERMLCNPGTFPDGDASP